MECESDRQRETESRWSTEHISNPIGFGTHAIPSVCRDSSHNGRELLDVDREIVAERVLPDHIDEGIYGAI